MDDLGIPVRLAASPRRVVSLAPSTTELLFTLGFGSRVVGRTRWCDYPPEAVGIPSVGDGLQPNIEAVAARKPDLVVMYATPANATTVRQLDRLGIASANLKMDRLRDVPHAARLIGALLGERGRVDSMARGFERALDSMTALPHPSRRRVALIVWDNPPIVIGAGSFLNDLIQLAGAENVFGDLHQPSPTVSVETIAGRDPALLLLLGNDSAGLSLAKRPEWKAVGAVREHRFAVLSGSEFTRPSFRAIQAVAELEALIGSGQR